MSEINKSRETMIDNRGSWRLAMACGAAMAAMAAMAGCFGNGPVTPSWKPWQESNAALADARAGNGSAMHRSFHAAFAEVMRPFPNQGEAARGIADNLDSILVAVGDKAFADALLRERPLTRSAVRDCMVEGDLEKRYPLTYEVFQEAPQNEWPSDMEKGHESDEQPPPPAPDESQ